MTGVWRTWMQAPRVASTTNGARARLGGFNLLPYRQRNARFARRRRILEWLVAAMVGCVGVLAFAGWQAWEKARFDTQRAALDHSFELWRAPLAEHAALLEARDDQRKGAALAKTLSEPLGHLRDLLDALSFEPGDGVVLQQLHQREYDTDLLATSQGHVASAEWLKRLSAVRGVKGAEVSDLHPAAVARNAIATNPKAVTAPVLGAMPNGAIEFGAHLSWRDLPLRKLVAANVDAQRAGKHEQSRGEK